MKLEIEEEVELGIHFPNHKKLILITFEGSK